MSASTPADLAVEVSALGAEAAASRLLAYLGSLADPHNVAGMGRFGISTKGTLGVSMTVLRSVARPLLRVRRADAQWRHAVAAALWASGIHEARILAALLDDPALVTCEQAHAWAGDSDSWDITDQLCMNLLDKTPLADGLINEWAAAQQVFVKRAAFSLIASLAWHDKDSPVERFLPFLVLIEREATDDRNFVTKAIDWALRQLGKRSTELNAAALATAVRLQTRPERAARRVGRVAARELQSEAVRRRLGL